MASVSGSPAVLVGPCEFGRGVFAARGFAPGEPILRFTGPLLTLAEALALGPLHGNTLQVAPAGYLDLAEPGVLANHSCDPNAGATADATLVAARPIRRGDEVRWDYSTSMADGTWEMACRCGAAACRGVVRDFEHLPAEVRARYLAAGLVLAFIAREHGFREGRRGDRTGEPRGGVRPAARDRRHRRAG